MFLSLSRNRGLGTQLVFPLVALGETEAEQGLAHLCSGGDGMPHMGHLEAQCSQYFELLCGSFPCACSGLPRHLAGTCSICCFPETAVWSGLHDCYFWPVSGFSSAVTRVSGQPGATAHFIFIPLDPNCVGWIEMGVGKGLVLASEEFPRLCSIWARPLRIILPPVSSPSPYLKYLSLRWAAVKIALGLS